MTILPDCKLVCNYRAYISVTNSAILKDIFKSMLVESGHTILSFIDHHFEPDGYTALWLLSESHLAIHTFPERAVTYIEISSCNEGKLEILKHHLLVWAGLRSGQLSLPVS